MSGLRITNDISEMDFSSIHSAISLSYWAKDIPEDVMRRAMEHSLCFGVLDDNASQIGFARVVTDFATFGYLADVYISESHRGRGVGKWLVKTILEHPDLQGFRRIALATRDAHGLYEQFGFKGLARPAMFMEILNPNAYSKTQ